MPVYEWEFDVPSDRVNVEDIYDQLMESRASAVFQHSYLEQLKIKAPIVFGRLRDWARANGKMNWVKWD